MQVRCKIPAKNRDGATMLYSTKSSRSRGVVYYVGEWFRQQLFDTEENVFFTVIYMNKCRATSLMFHASAHTFDLNFHIVRPPCLPHTTCVMSF
jgi:hypothetical protein